MISITHFCSVGGIGAAGRPHREISCRACTALYNNSTRVSGPARRKCGCAKTAIIVSYIALCMTQVKAPDLKRLEKYVRIIGSTNHDYGTERVEKESIRVAEAAKKMGVAPPSDGARSRSPSSNIGKSLPSEKDSIRNMRSKSASKHNSQRMRPR